MPFGITAFLGSVVAGEVVIQGVKKMVGPVLEGYERERRHIEFNRLVESISATHTFAPDEKKSEFLAQTMAGSREAAELLIEAFESLLNGVDEEVKPYIAALYASYATSGKSRDRFFRSVGRLLSDASIQEVNAIRTVLKLIMSGLLQNGVTDFNSVRKLQIKFQANRGRLMLYIVLGGDKYLDGNKHDEFEVPADLPRDWELAVGLLKDHHLATDTSGGVLSLESGPNVLLFEHRHMEGLQKLLPILMIS